MFHVQVSCTGDKTISTAILLALCKPIFQDPITIVTYAEHKEFNSVWLLGMSYNPSYRDHQDLLQEVANKELMLIKEEKHLKRVTSKMFSRVTEDEREVHRSVKLLIIIEESIK